MNNQNQYEKIPVVTISDACVQGIIAPTGIGRITAGSSKRQVEEILGERIALDEWGNAEIECLGVGLTLTFVGDTLMCLATESGKFQTREGARVGSSLGDLRKCYGNRLKEWGGRKCI